MFFFFFEKKVVEQCFKISSYKEKEEICNQREKTSASIYLREVSQDLEFIPSRIFPGREKNVNSACFNDA